MIFIRQKIAIVLLALCMVLPVLTQAQSKLKKKKYWLTFKQEQLAEEYFVDGVKFLMLEANAALILSDSGGIQEEACILKVPCVRLRTTTERPETVTVGANVLAGVRSKNIVRASKRMIRKPRKWRNPYGDGTASYKILKLIKNYKPLF